MLGILQNTGASRSLTLSFRSVNQTIDQSLRRPPWDAPSKHPMKVERLETDADGAEVVWWGSEIGGFGVC